MTGDHFTLVSASSPGSLGLFFGRNGAHDPAEQAGEQKVRRRNTRYTSGCGNTRTLRHPVMPAKNRMNGEIS